MQHGAVGGDAVGGVGLVGGLIKDSGFLIGEKYSRCAPYFSTVRNDGYAALTSSKYITVTCSSSPKVK